MEFFLKTALTALIITVMGVGFLGGSIVFGGGGPDSLSYITEFISDSSPSFTGSVIYINKEFQKGQSKVAQALKEHISIISKNPFELNLGSVASAVFEEESKEIRVHLDEKKVYLYERGELVGEYPVLSIGKDGSPWETPSGSYSIKTKEENHFSSIGEVYMPHSMQFFGNFFIHGWPYYEDGTPVSPGYSGGCIRLSSIDAKKVFEFSDIGTIVNIESDSNISSEKEESFYLREHNPDFPRPKAKAYLVADIETGDILLARNMDAKLPIASVSKLVTALTSLEVVNQFQLANISASAIETHGTSGELSVGEQIETGELLYPLLLESSNDAAEATAIHYGRDNFIKHMNEKSKAIGLKDTSFEDPSGLSPFNISTAKDLFKLAQHIYKNKKYIFDTTLIDYYESTKSSHSHTWKNNNPFVFREDLDYVGGKHGYTTPAGHTLVALFDLPLSEFENRTVAVVLLKSDNWEDDAKKVLNYLEKYVYYGLPPTSEMATL